MRGPDEAGDPDLSIVICTHNRYDDLPNALRSIETQSLALDRYELIVVDNSSDQAAQARFLDGLELVSSNQYLIERRPGVSRARNIGVEASRAAIVAFLDDDAIADPDWAAVILERFAADASIAVLGGPIEPIWPAGRPDWLPAALAGFFTIVHHGPVPRRLDRRELLPAANLAYRRAAVVEAGGFDEALGRVGAYLLSNEELELNQRIGAAGHVIFYDPAMRVRHRVHAERVSQDWVRRRLAWQVLSDIMSDPTQSRTDRTRDTALIDRVLRGATAPAGASNLTAEVIGPEALMVQADAISAMMRLLLLAPE